MTPSRSFFAGLVVAAGSAFLVATAASGGNAPGRTVVALRPDAPASARDALRAAGASRVDAELRLWEVTGEKGRRLVGSLRRQGVLASAAPVRNYDATATTADVADPLLAEEWWRNAIDLGTLEAPGPGVPVTVVDSGVDLPHPEFVGRGNLVALNAQEPAPVGGEHGTMVTSVIGAPVNGVGAVGIYPQAVIHSWDTALGEGRSIDSVQVAQGILAAARAGRGVINLSLGGAQKDPTVSLAIAEAVARGSLIVAASGNDGEEGSPLSYPAADRHVVTVAATDPNDQVASFSSRSPYVDLAAPGQDILVASAISGSWEAESGTSFSAPIVSGAAAWIWTMRPELDASQVAEILRRSARDLAPAGRDDASGFGLLDVAAALAAPVPSSDPAEPNDTIAAVTPGSATNLAHAPALTSPSKSRASLVAREDRYEDPTDIYRVWIPAKRTLTVKLNSSGDNDVVLSSGGTTPRRLAAAKTAGTHEQLTYKAGKLGVTGYLEITLGTGATNTTYSLAARIR